MNPAVDLECFADPPALYKSNGYGNAPVNQSIKLFVHNKGKQSIECEGATRGSSYFQLGGNLYSCITSQSRKALKIFMDGKWVIALGSDNSNFDAEFYAEGIELSSGQGKESYCVLEMHHINLAEDTTEINFQFVLHNPTAHSPHYSGHVVVPVVPAAPEVNLNVSPDVVPDGAGEVSLSWDSIGVPAAGQYKGLVPNGKPIDLGLFLSASYLEGDGAPDLSHLPSPLPRSSDGVQVQVDRPARFTLKGVTQDVAKYPWAVAGTNSQFPVKLDLSQPPMILESSKVIAGRTTVSISEFSVRTVMDSRGAVPGFARTAVVTWKTTWATRVELTYEGQSVTVPASGEYNMAVGAAGGDITITASNPYSSKTKSVYVNSVI